MDSSKAHRIVLGSWLVMAVMATIRYQQKTNNAGWPSPHIYLGSAALFSMLWLAASWQRIATLTAVLAVGLDVGVVVQPYLAGTGVGIFSTMSQWLAAVAGGQVQTNQSGQPTNASTAVPSPVANTPPGVQPGQGPSDFAPFGVTPPNLQNLGPGGHP